MKVLVAFTDDKDGNHVYRPGDEYPRKGGARPSEARINYLLGDRNKFRKPLIEKTAKKEGDGEGK